MAKRGPHGDLTEYVSICIQLMLCDNSVHKKNTPYLIALNEYF